MSSRTAVQNLLFFLRWQVYPLTLALPAHAGFVLRGAGKRTGPSKRVALALKAIWIHLRVECGHLPKEALHVLEEVVELDPQVPGVLVECGCFKGATSAKISHAAALAGRRLIVCDSFEGLPEVTDKDHTEIKRDFKTGEYSGQLDQVSGNVARFGRPELVEYVPGWFSESLGKLGGTPIACAFWDVDLHDSFIDCIKGLWAGVAPGAKVFIHDIDREPVVRAFSNRDWWLQEIGSEPPALTGAYSGLSPLSRMMGYATKS
jgi:O-methyltransferase